MSESTCRICGKPIDAHGIEFRHGVAHTVSYEGNTARLCSLAWADYEYLIGEMQALLTVMRSLKWRAGRLRNHGGGWQPYDLDAYAFKLLGDAERYRRAAESVFKEK